MATSLSCVGLLALVVALSGVASAQQPAPFVDCRNVADGLYVQNPKACVTHFFKCANGRQFHYECPAGLFFSVEDARCEHKATIIACGGVRQKPMPPTMSPKLAQALVAPAVPANRMRPIYQIAYNAPATPEAAAATNLYAAPSIAADTPITAADYVAPMATEDAVLAASSSSYNQQAPLAVAAQPQQLQAYGSSSQYSSAQSALVGAAPLAASLIPLAEPASPRPRVDFECAGRPDGYHVKRPCTPVYYHCAAGSAQEIRCPADLVYDSSAEICDRPGDCGRPKPRTTTTRAPPTTPRSTKCQSLADGFHEYGRCHPRYLHCSNGFAHEIACQAGLVFRNDTCVHLNDCINPTRAAPVAVVRTTPRPVSLWCQQNNKPDGTFGSGCSSKYFVCLGGQTMEMLCPGNLVFDPILSSCDQRSFVVACGGFRPPPTTTLVPPIAVARPTSHYDCGARGDGIHFDGCASQYWSCNGGIGTKIDCPASLRYSPAIHSCDYPQHIPECGGKLQPQSPPLAAQSPGFGAAQQAYGNSQSSSYSYQAAAPAPVAAAQQQQAAYGSQLAAPIAPTTGDSYGTSVVQAAAAPAIAAETQSYGAAASYESAAPAAAANYEAPAAPVAPVAAVASYEAAAPAPAAAATYETPAAPIAAVQAYETPVAVVDSAAAGYNSYGSQQQAPLAAASSSSSSSYSSSSASSYGSSASGGNIAAPLGVSTGTEEDVNPCANLSDGIYGRRCTRHYFVCSANKTYEFTCPTGYAYDKQLARCGIVSGIPMCSDIKPIIA